MSVAVDVDIRVSSELSEFAIVEPDLLLSALAQQGAFRRRVKPRNRWKITCVRL